MSPELESWNKRNAVPGNETGTKTARNPKQSQAKDPDFPLTKTNHFPTGKMYLALEDC